MKRASIDVAKGKRAKDFEIMNKRATLHKDKNFEGKALGFWIVGVAATHSGLKLNGIDAFIP